MATVAENIATIQAKAAELDDLVTEFRAAKAIIDAAETEIRQAQYGANHGAHFGRVRLAHYAHDLMTRPALTASDKTVAQVATAAWQGVS